MGFISFIIGFLVRAESCAHIFTSYRWVWNIEFHILPLFISGQHHDCQFSLFPLRISEVWRDLNLSQGMGHTKVWDMEQSRSWEHQTPAPVAEELWLLHCNADTLPLSTGRKIVGKGHLHGSWLKKKKKNSQNTTKNSALIYTLESQFDAQIHYTYLKVLKMQIQPIRDVTNS